MRAGIGSLAVAVALVAPLVAVAQVNLQPKPAPTVTAEERPWFRAREPIVFAGSLYYPSGPRVYFNRDDMIHSGYYDWVPLYTRTTQEPNSILFVPAAGGLLQPYERRRAGEPVSGSPSAEWIAFPQPASSLGSVLETADRGTAATTGFVAPTKPGVFRSAEKPQGFNGVFVEYGGKRWFNSGPAISLSSAELVPSGTYSGLTVYVKPGDASTIYIPVAEPASSLVTPYKSSRSMRR